MTLYLIPTPLGKQKQNTVLPESVLDQVRRLDLFFVENIHTARSFLQWVGGPLPDYQVTVLPLTAKTAPEVLHEYIRMIRPDRPAGLLSEAGCPGLADPGANLVAFAHRFKVKVVPLVGPSSIVLALMASGLNGQHFSFQGYLPREAPDRQKAIRQLSTQVMQTGQTIICMEAPQRNQVLAQELIAHLDPQLQLCLASELTLDGEWIQTRPVSAWRSQTLPDLSKKPMLFLIGR